MAAGLDDWTRKDVHSGFLCLYIFSSVPSYTLAIKVIQAEILKDVIFT